MNYKQLTENGYQYVALQNKHNEPSASILKIAIVTDKTLEGYVFDHTEGKNQDIAVFNQL